MTSCEKSCCEQELQAEIVLLTFLVQFPKGGRYRNLGICVYVYWTDDPNHERYDIKVKIPHIVSSIS